MVTATYEHIVIILLVGIIFVGTVVALPAINHSTFQSIDQQQLKNTAINVLNSILLGGGSPTNWGATIPTTVEEFGLAKSSPFSKYVLDSDKVQRINQENPWHLTREEVQDLLKLQGYKFNFTLYRPFKTIPLLSIDRDNNKIDFGVTVMRSQDGAPIPNAEVSVTIFMSSLSEDSTSNYGPYTTDSTGRCFDYMTIGPGVLSVIAIMEITVGGMSTIVVKQDSYVNLNEFIRIDTAGDIIRLSLRTEEMEEETGIPPAERDITNIWAIKSDDRIEISDNIEKITWGKGYEYVEILCEGLSELDATALVIRLEVVIPSSSPIEDLPPSIRGRTFPVYICGALNYDATDEIFSFGFDTPTETAVAQVRRFVVISDMTYIAELGLWKDIL